MTLGQQISQQRIWGKNLADEIDRLTQPKETMIHGSIGIIGTNAVAYLAGKMRGVENFNFPAFDTVEQKAIQYGFIKVFNPAKMDRDDADPSHKAICDDDATKLSRVYAKRDVKAILQCTHMIMLPGWETSVGATAEYYLARWLCLEILDAETFEPLDVTGQRAELMQFHRQMCAKALSVMRAKNADYGATDDPFANFRSTEALDICPAETSFLVRWSDKLKRVTTFVKRGMLMVKDETVEDNGFEIAKVSMSAEALESNVTHGVNWEKKLTQLIRDFNLPRECVPTEALKSPAVWESLLENMPMTAMIRNLGNMSKCGLLKPLSKASGTVCARLVNTELLRKARIHPVALLLALKTYSQGKGIRGSGEWTVVPTVVDALDEAFYRAFQFVEPTNKRFLIGVDVSGSMSAPCAFGILSCAEGAAAMALTIAKTEPVCYVHGFCGGAGPWGTGMFSSSPSMRMDGIEGFVDLDITPRMRMDDVLFRTSNRTFGGTDCAIPMLYASKQQLEVDAFIVITDNETWAGNIHPVQALAQYRKQTGISAKLIVMGMTATKFTIADPNDPGMLDVAGFDAAVPVAINEFVRD